MKRAPRGCDAVINFSIQLRLLVFTFVQFVNSFVCNSLPTHYRRSMHEVPKLCNMNSVYLYQT